MKQKLVSLYKTIGGSSDRDVRTNGRSGESDREREYASSEERAKRGAKQPYRACFDVCEIQEPVAPQEEQNTLKVPAVRCIRY